MNINQKLLGLRRKMFGKTIYFNYTNSKQKKVNIRRVGGYRVINRLGRVYLAEKKGSKYIVKFLNPISTNLKVEKYFFFHEIEVLKMLDNQSIVKVIDSGILNKRQHSLKILQINYKVYNYIKGETLYNLLKEKKIKSENKTSIALQLCDTLQFIHEQGIIHTDFNPYNIIISNDQKQIDVIDFEFARYQSKLNHANLDKYRFYTPEYAAPEQKLGKHKLSHKTDIFSLGVILFELFTDRDYWNDYKYPYHDFNIELTSNLKLGKEMKHIIKTCLEIYPEKRMISIKEIRNSLL